VELSGWVRRGMVLSDSRRRGTVGFGSDKIIIVMNLPGLGSVRLGKV
jgi:hypothetical protein